MSLDGFACLIYRSNDKSQGISYAEGEITRSLQIQTDLGQCFSPLLLLTDARSRRSRSRTLTRVCGEREREFGRGLDFVISLVTASSNVQG